MWCLAFELLTGYLLSGQTSANKVKTIQGQSDTKLSEIGIKQSEQLAQHLDGNRYHLIYSSDLSRALDTAKIALKEHQSRIQTDRRLRERGFGSLEGKSIDELKRLALQNGIPPSKLSQFTPEGGETLEQVNQRVVDFLTSRVIKEVASGNQVLVISHGGVIRETIKYLKESLKCQFPKGSAPTIITPNTSFNEFKVVYDSEKLISAECLKLHDIQHLTGEMRSSALNQEQINDTKPETTGDQEAL